ncbi:MAG: GGDEF domain-containing protein [Oscillospiraceae bacterium]|nr:GGDEF domain-containing protein [Oscillospiraceae bacterium]
MLLDLTASQIHYIELNLLCIITLLMLARKLRLANKSIEQSYLIALLAGESALFLSDMLWEIIDGKMIYPVWANYAVNIMYFTVLTACPYLCLKYLYLSLGGKDLTRRQRYYLQIPVWATLILSVMSVKTGLVFYITAGNRYGRGPLYLFICIASLVYTLADSLYALLVAIRTEQKYLRVKALRLAGVMFLPAVGSAMELVFPQLAVACSFITITMVSVIFDFQQQQITRDALTQLSNRRDLMTHLEGRFADRNRFLRRPVYVIYADIDLFKQINDAYGHLEGDHALCYVADVLRAVCGTRDAFPARIGGDEFVVVFSASNDQTAESFRQNLKDAVQHISEKLPYDLAISAGMTRCTEQDQADIPALLSRADEQLYQEKKNRKRG